MLTVINSIPLGIRLSILIICEVILICDYRKHRKDYNKTKTIFPLLLTCFIPVFVICMVFEKLANIGTIPISSESFSDTIPLVISIVFVLVILGTGIFKLMTGNVSPGQRNTMIAALLIILLGVVFLVGITIFENRGTAI